MLKWLGLINTESFIRKKWFRVTISHSCLCEGGGAYSRLALHNFLCFPLFAQERGLDCVLGIVLPGTKLTGISEWYMLIFQRWKSFQPIKSLYNCICSNMSLPGKGFRSGMFIIQDKICLTFRHVVNVSVTREVGTYMDNLQWGRFCVMVTSQEHKAQEEMGEGDSDIVLNVKCNLKHAAEGGPLVSLNIGWDSSGDIIQPAAFCWLMSHGWHKPYEHILACMT